MSGEQVHSLKTTRAFDMAFYGIGLPCEFQLVSLFPEHMRTPGVVGSAGGWFWHTEEDTIDKADKDTLLFDSKFYLTSILRLCTCLILPFEFVTMADDFISALERLQKHRNGALDLNDLL